MSYVDAQLLPGEVVRYRARLHKLMFAVPASLAAIAAIVTLVTATAPPAWQIARPLEFRRQVQAAIASVEEARAQVSAPAGAYAAERVERDCPYCAERILARAKVCKHCGREVTPTVSA